MQLVYSTKRMLIGLCWIISLLYTSILFADNLKLENYSYLGEFKKEVAKQILDKIPPLNTLQPMYSVSLYKIHYKTTAPDGTQTSASGLVAMPVTPSKQVGIVSFHHGTRVTRSDVPSSFKENSYFYPAVFSSSGGYMLVMPDYLGLGDSNLPIHPYVLADTLASSSIDMLIAAKELAHTLNYPVSDKLYLAGYSEGGFTTMVTYEELLKNHGNLPVTAAAPGSAPYDWNETVRYITLTPGPRSSVYLAYFFYSMQTYNHYWSGLDTIFKQPYDTLIPTMFDGTHEAADIIAALPADPRQILKDDFFDALLNGTEIHTQQLITNFNHYQFKSTSPLLLVGTRGDKDLPYHGAEMAYQEFKKQSDTVYIKSVSDVLDHIQAMPYVMKEQLEFFKQYN